MTPNCPRRRRCSRASNWPSRPRAGWLRPRPPFDGAWQRSLAEQLDVERDAQRDLGRSADYAEGVAAFIEKRAALFKGQ